jgi:hypothetical protein
VLYSYLKGVVVKRSKLYCGFKNHIKQNRSERRVAALHLLSGYNPDYCAHPVGCTDGYTNLIIIES